MAANIMTIKEQLQAHAEVSGCTQTKGGHIAMLSIRTISGSITSCLEAEAQV
jgi:hypothetical protein